jgi:hypothetical protein
VDPEGGGAGVRGLRIVAGFAAGQAVCLITQGYSMIHLSNHGRLNPVAIILFALASVVSITIWVYALIRAVKLVWSYRGKPYGNERHQ